MPKEKILDAVVRTMKPSNQKFITRYHVTAGKNIPSIRKSGLDIAYTGSGFGEGLPFNKLNEGVFTSVGASYAPGQGDVRLEIKIPKDEYRRMPRADYNLEFGEGDGRNYSLKSFVRNMHTVNNHGRTDIFEDSIPPDWIVGVRNGIGNTYSLDDFYKRLGCDPSTSEWCADFLDDLGYLDTDEETGELMNGFPW